MVSRPILPNLECWDPTPLRECFRRAAFQRKSLELLGLPDRWLRGGIPQGALLGHVPEGSPLDALLRLFTLGDSIEGEHAFAALGDAIHGLLKIEFLHASGGRVRSNYQICPVSDHWIACDFPRRQGEGADDFVMGIGPSSVLLSALTPSSSGRALELACGVGWLSGKLAMSGMDVVASDINPRALALGRLSARLSDIDGIDFRQGDGLAAVQNEMFDLIVANPPYVQSPGGTMTYKEAEVGDPVCARLLREIHHHLKPGGIAIVLINWTHATDEDWPDAPLSWVAPAGVHRWLFQSDCSSTADYAWTWISTDLRFREQQAAANEMRRWLAHYRSHGINRVSAGFIVLQKCRPGEEWTRTESRAAEDIRADAGEELRRILDNETWLSGNNDVLDQCFSVPDGVRAEVCMTLGDDGWARETIRLTSASRLGYDGQIDENLLRLLELTRSGKTPAKMLEEIRAKPEFAGMTGLPERINELTRELVRHGVLVPIEHTSFVAQSIHKLVEQ